MRWTVLRGSGLQPVPWRNGHGTARMILTRLGRNGALLWQVGLAELEGDAPFSRYPGCERVFIPMSGATPELSFADGPWERCELLEPRRFSGEVATSMRIGAPGRAFNLIADRNHGRADAQVLRLEAGDPVPAPDAEEVVIHCVAGEVSTAGDLLEAGDSLLGPGPASPAAAATDALVIVAAIHLGRR